MCAVEGCASAGAGAALPSRLDGSLFAPIPLIKIRAALPALTGPETAYVLTMPHAQVGLLHLARTAYQPACQARLQWHARYVSTFGGCASAGAEAALPSWLDGGSSRSLAALPASCCLAGEALEVAVGVHNPLALELALTRVSLLFEHDGGGGDAADAALLAEVGPSLLSWRGVKMVPSYSAPGV